MTNWPISERTMRGQPAGFTLIELLVTIAIAAIAMAIGIPSFLTFQRNAELTSASNGLIAAINAARGEAMKRNLTTYVVPVDPGNWASGFTVFVNKKTTVGPTYSDGTDLLISKQSTNLPPYLTVTGAGATATGSTPFLRFNGSGYSVDGTGFVGNAITIKRNDIVNAADQLKNTRNVIIARTGRVRVCIPQSTSDNGCRTDDAQYLN